MIHIKSLTKKFSGQTVFSDLNLSIPFNQTTVLSGPSGCGKTTLLRILAGLDSDYEGTVTGVPQSVSFMFQEDRLLPWRSARENIEFVLKDVMDKNTMNGIVSGMISAVALSGSEDKPPEKLSGGMKRRVAMARSYCYPGDIYLLDEPFKGFDAKLQEDMLALFEELFVKTAKTVVFVTHDEAVIGALGQNIVDLSSFSHSA